MGTDATWRSADGPIVFSHIFAGEDFDARRQQPGWDRPGFDDRAWQPVRIAADFQRHFRDPATGQLRHLGSPQCANAMALCAEVVPAADWAALVAEIIADLEKRDWQQTPGDVGHVYFIRALAEAGRILSRWRIQDGTFHLTAEIPAGTAATAILPSGASKPLRPGLNDLTEPWKSGRLHSGSDDDTARGWNCPLVLPARDFLLFYANP